MSRHESTKKPEKAGYWPLSTLVAILVIKFGDFLDFAEKFINKNQRN